MAIETTEQLARRWTIRAFRLGRYILIVAEGDLPTPGDEADIEPNPIRMYPQQYNVLRRRRPGIWPQVITPYRVGELFMYPEDQRVVTVHHAGGLYEVKIQESVKELAKFAALLSEERRGLDGGFAGFRRLCVRTRS